jgi:hypothetical protein
MKKLLCLFLAFLFFCSCGPKQDEVERYMEDGVEIIVNHLEPYKIKGEPSTLHLEEEFTIDTEKDEIAKVGLTDIQGFDVGSEQNIYFFKPFRSHSKEDLIYMFDSEGKFITSFLIKGQGPGEVQRPSYQRITSRGEIPIVDAYACKFLLFDSKGSLINQVYIDSDIAAIGYVVPLENGNYLARRIDREPSKIGRESSGEYVNLILSIFNSQFEEMKEIDRFKRDQRIRNPYLLPIIFWAVSNGNIYIGNSERGYEIWAFDLNGNLLKKIKKKYKPVKFPNEIKEKYRKRKLNFPDYEPPFQCMSFTDDDGRLFVMTFEKGENPKEYLFDIFNSDGVFIGRTSLDVYVRRATLIFPLYAKAKNKRLYCLREKESGYKKLVVYKMRWE